MFLKAKKIVVRLAALILVVAWFTHGYLENTYVNYPRAPQPEYGRIVPYPVKGIVTYITAGQQDFLSRLTWIEISSGAVVVLVILSHWGDPFRSRKRTDGKLRS
jgi:hypothetical protein